MTDTIERIKAIAQQLREVFPGTSVQLSVDQFGDAVSVSYHGTRTYHEAEEWFRALGIQRRDKRVWPTYTALTGERDGVQFTTYPDELPPCCRKIEKIERIPKIETKETGEFVEIKRMVIECGPQSDGEKVEVVA